MDFDAKLIEEVKKYEHIYNFKHQNHRKREVVQNSWRSIALSMDSDVQAVQKRWKAIRDKFEKERKRPSGSAALSVWPLFQMLLFLTDHVQHRQSSSNFGNNGKENDRPESYKADNNDDNLLGEQFFREESNKKSSEEELLDNQLAENILETLANGDVLDLTESNDEDSSLIHDQMQDKILEKEISDSSSKHFEDEESVVPLKSENCSVSSFASRKSKLPQHVQESRVGKKRKKADDDSKHLLNMLKSTDDLIINACQSSKALDKDDYFGQQVAEELKSFSAYKSSLAKVKIQQILMEVNFMTDENH